MNYFIIIMILVDFYFLIRLLNTTVFSLFKRFTKHRSQCSCPIALCILETFSKNKFFCHHATGHISVPLALCSTVTVCT